mmetsp:Transcript_95500/g.275744  ORF Transcript_95500/g.275744 Transcript_95500/m.275744 type:complete len:218 (+) Transcript_95500:833-1486(+)
MSARPLTGKRSMCLRGESPRPVASGGARAGVGVGVGAAARRPAAKPASKSNGTTTATSTTIASTAEDCGLEAAPSAGADASTRDDLEALAPPHASPPPSPSGRAMMGNCGGKRLSSTDGSKATLAPASSSDDEALPDPCNSGSLSTWNNIGGIPAAACAPDAPAVGPAPPLLSSHFWPNRRNVPCERSTLDSWMMEGAGRRCSGRMGNVAEASLGCW